LLLAHDEAAPLIGVDVEFPDRGSFGLMLPPTFIQRRLESGGL
jgi:hypothetical protein